MAAQLEQLQVGRTLSEAVTRQLLVQLDQLNVALVSIMAEARVTAREAAEIQSKLHKQYWSENGDQSRDVEMVLGGEGTQSQMEKVMLYCAMCIKNLTLKTILIFGKKSNSFTILNNSIFQLLLLCERSFAKGVVDNLFRMAGSRFKPANSESEEMAKK